MANADELPKLPLFEINMNPDGWGPTTLPVQFLDKPYAPFSKTEKLGRIADFSSRNRYGRRYQQQQYEEEPEEAFHMVDTGKAPPRRNFRRRRFGGYRRWNNRYQNRGNKGVDQNKKGKRSNGNSRFNRRRQRWKNHLYRPRDNKQYHVRQSSVKVQTDWEVIEQFDMKNLSKLSAPKPKSTEDLLWCGHLDEIDEKYDKVSVRVPRALERVTDRQFFYVTTTDDEIIEQLATEGKGNVFATDTIMAHLMAAARSVYPWDIIIQRVGEGENKTLFFDKREDQLDYLTVNETAHEPPNPEDKDSINSAFNLSVEATAINQSFSQQILKRDPKKRKTFDVENPFFDPDEAEKGMQPASVAYRYRRWVLGDTIKLVARTEIHAISPQKGVYSNIYALNEWDSKLAGSVDWRKKLDKQRGAVLATELKNNACKLAKWTAEALLAGADQMKIGYVSRSNRKDRSGHQILGTQYYKPIDFARQINLNVTNTWAVMRHFIEVSMKQPEGKYILMKDPNKAVLRLYKLPPGTFDDDDEE